MPGMLFAQEENRQRRSPMRFLFDEVETARPQYRPDPRTWSSETITATWISHATVLLNIFGTTIITDPVFSERAGINVLGMFTLGPKRHIAPALTIEELPPIDLILLSHAHMDHLDLPSLRQFDKTVPVVMAKNTSDILLGRGWRSVRELDWGESLSVGGVEIEALKVRHFGWRFPWEQDRSRGNWHGRSFNAYLLTKNNRSILFGGDTAYQEYFSALSDRTTPIELAIMPIGAYNPWIYAHANPEEAVAMANQMKARAILPIHWGTFTLSYEPMGEPIVRLKAALARHSPALALEAVGQTWTLPAA